MMTCGAGCSGWGDACELRFGVQHDGWTSLGDARAAVHATHLSGSEHCKHVSAQKRRKQFSEKKHHKQFSEEKNRKPFPWTRSVSPAPTSLSPSGRVDALGYAGHRSLIHFPLKLYHQPDLCSIKGVYEHRQNTAAATLATLLLVVDPTRFFGPASEIVSYFEQLGHRCGTNTNPAEFVADLISIDCSSPQLEASTRCV